MARIRPARGGSPDEESGERRTARPRPARQQQRVEKAGSVTKAVQVGRASRFMSEVATELRKVSWPTRPQLVQAVGVVIAFVVIVTAYLAVLDELFGRLVDAIF